MWWFRFWNFLVRILFKGKVQSISGCKIKIKERWTITKILDEFSRNGTTFAKHHLFDQVCWLGITARMRQKNSTVYIYFRSYQLCVLPFCHAWRHALASKWLPRYLWRLYEWKICCPAHWKFQVFTYHDRQSNQEHF